MQNATREVLAAEYRRIRQALPDRVAATLPEEPPEWFARRVLQLRESGLGLGAATKAAMVDYLILAKEA